MLLGCGQFPLEVDAAGPIVSKMFSNERGLKETQANRDAES
jgi:hypothetical protein